LQDNLKPALKFFSASTDHEICMDFVLEDFTHLTINEKSLRLLLSSGSMIPAIKPRFRGHCGYWPHIFVDINIRELHHQRYFTL